MNRYVAIVRYEHANGFRRRDFTIEASNIRTAATRALQGFERRDDVAVSVRLLERDIVRPRIERGSHGQAHAL